MTRAVPPRKRRREGSGDSDLPLRRSSRHKPGNVTEFTNLAIGLAQAPSLCRRCEEIDLDNIFRREHIGSKRRLVQDLLIHRGYDDNCPLCLLFLKITPSRQDRTEILRHQSSTVHKLESGTCSQQFGWGWETVDKVVLTIGQAHEQPFLIPQSESESTVRLISSLVDFDLIKGWLRFCMEHHTKICCTDSPSGSKPSSGPLLSLISSFKLIDCETRTLVVASGQQYVTLSYLWGDSKASQFTWKLPKNLPPTIEDALVVTRALGFRYLWIDRFCIDQECQEERAEQVSRMDLVYRLSDLTIIAAAGSGPSFGLPGVGRNTRLPQPSARIGKHLLIAVSPNPVDVILRSAWSERGWTYQEGLLSRRRLIFTEQQVYFECGGMYCTEQLRIPLHDLHVNDHHQFKTSHCHGINVGLFPKELGSKPWEMISRVEDYSKRELGDPGDILNGILGIIKVFEAGSQKLRHCLGIPLFPKPFKHYAELRYEWQPGELTRKRNVSRKWSATIGFCLGLCWIGRHPKKRRANFPSWSWTGWFGEVKWWLNQLDGTNFTGEEDLVMHIQFLDGQIMNIEEFAQHPKSMEIQLSNVLHISAWGSQLKLRSHTDKGKGKMHKQRAYVQVKDKGRVRMRFQRTGNTALSEENCIAIHLGAKCDKVLEHHMCLLVVQEIETGSSIYERVGLGWMQMTRKDHLYDYGPRYWSERLLGLHSQPLPELVKSRYDIQLR